jgi:hypothetical protein
VCVRVVALPYPSCPSLSSTGDDQDLDDRVIRQLWEENRELKKEVSQLRSSSGDDADEGWPALHPCLPRPQQWLGMDYPWNHMAIGLGWKWPWGQVMCWMCHTTVCFPTTLSSPSATLSLDTQLQLIVEPPPSCPPQPWRPS